MKKLSVFLIVIWSLVALGIVGIILSSIAFNGMRRTSVTSLVSDIGQTFTSAGVTGSLELLADTSESMRGVDELSIAFSSDNVTILPADDDNLRVVHRGQGIPKDKAATVKRSGSKLSISRPSTNFRGFSSQTRSEVDIYVPESYQEDLEINLSSGNVDVKAALQLDEFKTTLSSGNIRLMQPLTAEEAEITVSSGNLTAEELGAEEYEITLLSGVVTINALYGSGHAQISSGKLSLYQVEIEERLSLQVSSGSCKVVLAGEPDFVFMGSKSSGSIHTYFPTDSGDKGKSLWATVGSKSDKSLDVFVSSGTVSIERE